MLLSPHFTLAELTTTTHVGIDNTPPPAIVGNLAITAAGLERIREILGNLPLTISSGYRSRALNAAVGGVTNSAHLTGWAADFTCPAFGEPLAVCRRLAASPLKFDQLIEEGTWVHVSFAPTMRHQLLTKDGQGRYVEGIAA